MMNSATVSADRELGPEVCALGHVTIPDRIALNRQKLESCTQLWEVFKLNLLEHRVRNLAPLMELQNRSRLQNITRQEESRKDPTRCLMSVMSGVKPAQNKIEQEGDVRPPAGCTMYGNICVQEAQV